MRHRPEDNDRENYNPDRRHEQNASDRWGQPDADLNLNNRQRRYNESNQQHDPHDDWRPFQQRDNRHFQGDDRYRREERPEWQQDRNFNLNNQHADDRWNEDRVRPPQQHHHPRHASERFYREQRRRND